MNYRMTIAGLTASLIATPAFAYLDPGTGSMLLQLILGGLAGIAVAGKLFWTQIMSFFSFGRSSSSSDDKSGDAEP